MKFMCTLNTVESWSLTTGKVPLISQWQQSCEILCPKQMWRSKLLSFYICLSSMSTMSPAESVEKCKVDRWHLHGTLFSRFFAGLRRCNSAHFAQELLSWMTARSCWSRWQFFWIKSSPRLRQAESDMWHFEKGILVHPRTRLWWCRYSCPLLELVASRVQQRVSTGLDGVLLEFACQHSIFNSSLFSVFRWCF